MPLTEPKCSSVVAYFDEVYSWESNWLEFHERHTMNAEYIAYRDLSDEDRPFPNKLTEDGSWDDDSDTEFLIRCCGEDRPLRTRSLNILVTPSTGSNFVTVYDYVSSKFIFLDDGVSDDNGSRPSLAHELAA